MVTAAVIERTERTIPQYVPPRGYRVEIDGPDVYLLGLRDKDRKPMPDGLHRARGFVINVRDGKLVADDK